MYYFYVFVILLKLFYNPNNKEKKLRVRREKNIDRKLELYRDTYLIDKDEISNKLSGKNNIYVEIGMGKGDFILELARRNPDNLYIGIERSDAVVLKALKKIENQKNLLFVIANIDDLRDQFENTFDGLYLNFSDPWPKKRHYKRRLLYREYLDLYDKWLKKGSLIQFKTDNDILFEFTLEELEETGREAFDVTRDLHEDSRYSDNIVTEYENKFSKMGFTIKGLRFYSR